MWLSRSLITGNGHMRWHFALASLRMADFLTAPATQGLITAEGRLLPFKDLPAVGTDTWYSWIVHSRKCAHDSYFVVLLVLRYVSIYLYSLDLPHRHQGTYTCDHSLQMHSSHQFRQLGGVPNTIILWTTPSNVIDHWRIIKRHYNYPIFHA